MTPPVCVDIVYVHAADKYLAFTQCNKKGTYSFTTPRLPPMVKAVKNEGSQCNKLKLHSSTAATPHYHSRRAVRYNTFVIPVRTGRCGLNSIDVPCLMRSRALHVEVAIARHLRCGRAVSHLGLQHTCTYRWLPQRPMRQDG